MDIIATIHERMKGSLVTTAEGKLIAVVTQTQMVIES